MNRASKESVSQEKRSKSMPASFSSRAVVALLQEKPHPVKTCFDVTPGNEAEMRKGGVEGGIDNGSQ